MCVCGGWVTITSIYLKSLSPWSYTLCAQPCFFPKNPKLFKMRTCSSMLDSTHRNPPLLYPGLEHAASLAYPGTTFLKAKLSLHFHLNHKLNITTQFYGLQILEFCGPNCVCRIAPMKHDPRGFTVTVNILHAHADNFYGSSSKVFQVIPEKMHQRKHNFVTEYANCIFHCLLWYFERFLISSSIPSLSKASFKKAAAATTSRLTFPSQYLRSNNVKYLKDHKITFQL